MKIETKFNIGDTVWIMKDNKPYKFKVEQILISVYSYVTTETYVEVRCEMNDYAEYHRRGTECFATKKELLDSFLEDEE